MLRRSWRFMQAASGSQFRDIVARLDSFEKEVVSLKAFRAAVERVSPEVATAAAEIAKARAVKTKGSDVVDMDYTLNPDEFGELYQIYALQPHRPVKLDFLMNINNLVDLVRYSHQTSREFATRLAKRAATLNNAPLGLGRMPSIEALRKHYEWSFHDIRSVSAPVDKTSALAFDDAVRRVFTRHINVRPLMFNGLQELAKREHISRKRLVEDPQLYDDYAPLQATFEDFIASRMKLRFLITHYMLLSGKILNVADPVPVGHYGHDSSTFSGAICRETSITKVIQCAVQEARATFKELDDEDFPKIDLKLAGDESFTFVGIPFHLCEIISGMIEAGVRANVVRSDEKAVRPTPIEIVVSQRPSNADVVVRVSDTAGGIPFDQVDQSLNYLYCCDTQDKHVIEMPYAAVSAKAFGGELCVASIDGYGTDRTFHIPSGKRLMSLEI